MCNIKYYIAETAAYFGNMLGEKVALESADKDLLERIPMNVSSRFSFYKASNPQPIGFSGILLAKRQNSFYCTYFLHNRNVAETKSPYPTKRLEVLRWFNQKSTVFNQSLS